MLWASGYLNTRDESVGLRIFGVDTASASMRPSETLVAANF